MRNVWKYIEVVQMGFFVLGLAVVCSMVGYLLFTAK